MKRAARLICLLLALLMLIGCGAPQEQTETPTSAPDSSGAALETQAIDQVADKTEQALAEIALLGESPDDNYRTWYEIFVYSFCDSNGDGIGDLPGLTSRLDYLQELGITGLWLMPIHPSTTYHKYNVSDYYAIDPAYGTLEDFKQLLDMAHAMGIRVLLDLVHSHAVKNTAEGINMFDGTTWQFFHDGDKGEHPAWGTKCFDYGKTGVIHFLLSNLKFWMTEYHFDGFRFDGVTSMLYHDHGLGTDFNSNDKYFSYNTHTEAITYLQLANELIRQVNPDAITVAEDMSGMPGMCLPIEDGGIGFDYRLAMGLPDMWIKAVKQQDEFWDINKMWGDMCLRRPGEGTVAYVESHDQALVGDQTMIFRLAGANMYTDMNKDCHNPVIDRAIALHKMIRLFTLAGGGEGYLNFMGNEFGHPEWIDFPREGNGWSHKYARRQWDLVDNKNLNFHHLGDFDAAMLQVIKSQKNIQKTPVQEIWHSDYDQILAYTRKDLLFVFNFNPCKSFTGYGLLVPAGSYEVVLNTDAKEFGGNGLNDDSVKHFTMFDPLHKKYRKEWLKLYLPARTAMVLRKCK